MQIHDQDAGTVKKHVHNLMRSEDSGSLKKQAASDNAYCQRTFPGLLCPKSEP